MNKSSSFTSVVEFKLRKKYPENQTYKTFHENSTNVDLNSICTYDTIMEFLTQKLDGQDSRHFFTCQAVCFPLSYIKESDVTKKTFPTKSMKFPVTIGTNITSVKFTEFSASPTEFLKMISLMPNLEEIEAISVGEHFTSGEPWYCTKYPG